MASLTKLQARKYREAILKIVNNLDDSTAIETPLLFPRWETGKQYFSNDRVSYEEILYKCLQNH